MPKPRRKQVLALPQGSAAWWAVVRELRAWTEEGDAFFQPWGLFVFEPQAELILGGHLFPRAPAPREILAHLHAAMLEPAHGTDYPSGRPADIIFEDTDLARRMRPLLREIDVRAIRREPVPQVDDLIRRFEAALNKDAPKIDGLLESDDVTPEIAKSFFAAAAAYFRAQPWVALNNSQTLAISFPPGEETWYVTVMGQGGVDYGMVVQRTWEQVTELFQNLDDPLEAVPREGWHAVSFEPRHMLPFADLEAIETHAWEVAGAAAYPLPLIFDRDRANRPPGVELQLWGRLMWGVVGLVKHGLVPDGAGDYQLLQVDVQLPAASGGGTAGVRYPAGERDKSDQALRTFAGTVEPKASEKRFDRRAMEGWLTDLTAPGDSPAQKAQQLMVQAWDEPDPARRLEMAEMALEVSADCADAYVLLAEDRAKTVGEALKLYAQGVAAGERALGPQPFNKDVGYFWGLLETRPYMRARQGLANCLWDLGRTDEAEVHYRDMLRLNPHDNQGLRYTLLRLLMDSGRDADALQLLDDHPDDPTARMRYNRGLLLFRVAGPGGGANKQLDEAMDYNAFVPPYLMGHKRVALEMPARIGFGDENEAIDYASAHLNHWRATPGAIEWLQERWFDS